MQPANEGSPAQIEKLLLRTVDGPSLARLTPASLEYPDKVGCPFTVSPHSSMVPSRFIARTHSPIKSVAPSPRIWTPRICPNSFSAMILTNPSDSPIARALPLFRYGTSPLEPHILFDGPLLPQTNGSNFRKGVDAAGNFLIIDFAILAQAALLSGNNPLGGGRRCGQASSSPSHPQWRRFRGHWFPCGD